MSAYEEDADRFAEHTRDTCEDPFCQICIEEDEAANATAEAEQQE